MVVLPSSFHLPPVDGTVPPALAVDFHLRHNFDSLFAILYDVNDSSETKISFKQLAHAVHRAAHLFNPNVTLAQGTNIGILASADTITYIAMFLGAMRAGLVPFPISPRIPVAGIAHLLTATRTRHVVVGGGPAIEELRTALETTLHHGHEQYPMNFLNLPTFEDLFGNQTSVDSTDITKQKLHAFPSIRSTSADAPVCILHSSGSTGMPKVVVFHLEGVFKNYVIRPVPQMLAAANTRVGTMALPTFHSMGTMMQVFVPLYAGYTQVLFAPSRTPVVPTSKLTLQAATCVSCDYLMCAPAFLENWVQDEDAISRLCKMKCAMFGGGSLAEAVGNKLVDRGVRLLPLYGATELGTVVELNYSEKDPYDWPYIKFIPHIDIHLDPQQDESETYELVYVESEGHKPFVYNSRIDGRSAYKSKDLVVRHPTNPNLFKLVGRLDDQIALLNGEKCNPLPMEVEIINSPHVHAAVVFGRERKQTGVIIELEEHLEGWYRDTQNRSRLVQEIWPYVEHANRLSPTHARLTRDAIVLADPGRPFPRTPKGTVSRSAVLQSYRGEIEEMYIRLEQDADAVDGVEPPRSWEDPSEIERWVGECVANILGREVDPYKDLFQQGMDSLTATILLRTLRGTLYASSENMVRSAASQLSQQTIFEKPAVCQIAELLIQLCSHGSVLVDSPAEILEGIRSMIKKYDSGWSKDQTAGLLAPRTVETERVLVTGTTGGLGSYLLAELIQNDKVEKVWALNRKSSKKNEERQRESFEDKLLDAQLLKSKKLVLLEACLEDSKLGLSDEVYKEIRSQVTVIVHNAWQVNFNLSLQSFEPSIQGAHNLLDLAFSSTSPTGCPRFMFTSSVSVAGFGGLRSRLAETYLKLEDAAATDGIGYGQSKLVTEQLLESARRRGLETCIMRLGQLTGDAKCGAWSTKDWIPAILASSLSVGCLPAAAGSVSWIPLDVAARLIVDASTVRSGILPPVVHVSHPRPVPWSDVMTLFSDVLTSQAKSEASLPIIQFDEWKKRVGESAASFQGSEWARSRRFPSTKIQSTIDRMARVDQDRQDDIESGGIVRLDTAEAERLSEALRGVSQLGRKHVESWVNYWEKRGLFA